MLQGLVAEMNLYAESPEEAVKWLNIKLDLGESRIDKYLIQQLVVGGRDITSHIQSPTWRGNPATSDMVVIDVYGSTWLGYKNWQVYFSPQNHLVSGNVTSGEYVLVDELRGSKAVLMKSRRKSPMAMAQVLMH